MSHRKLLGCLPHFLAQSTSNTSNSFGLSSTFRSSVNFKHIQQFSPSQFFHVNFNSNLILQKYSCVVFYHHCCSLSLPLSQHIQYFNLALHTSVTISQLNPIFSHHMTSGRKVLLCLLSSTFFYPNQLQTNPVVQPTSVFPCHLQFKSNSPEIFLYCLLSPLL